MEVEACVCFFGRSSDILEDKRRFLITQFEDIIKGLGLEKAVVSHSRDRGVEVSVRWEAPQERWAPLNTDGASKGNSGVATSGGVMRGAMGEWIKGFSESFRVCTSVKTELKAALYGLRMAHSLEIKKLWLPMDSMVLLGMLRGNRAWNPVSFL